MNAFSDEPELTRKRLTGKAAERSAALRTRLQLARAVAGARIRCGWTQSELAQRAGTKQSRVSEIETGRGNPRLDTIERIASALELELALVAAASAIVDEVISQTPTFSWNTIASELRYTEHHPRLSLLADEPSERPTPPYVDDQSATRFTRARARKTKLP